MKVSSSQSTSATGDTSPDDLQQQLDDLGRMTQMFQTQTQAGAQANPQLTQGIENGVRSLQVAQQMGQLSPDQSSQLNNTIGAPMQHSVQPPGQGQGTTQANSYPMDDKYEGGMKAGHHKGGHAHMRAQATPPVDSSDPGANTLNQDPTATG